MSNLSEPYVGKFTEATERRRVTGSVLRAYRNLALKWRLRDDQAAALIGFDPETWVSAKESTWEGVLSVDQLARLSALFGIFSALQGFFDREFSDRWPTMPNKGPIFGGQSPVSAMIDGGIARIIEVRRHVEYWAYNGW